MEAAADLVDMPRPFVEGERAAHRRRPVIIGGGAAVEEELDSRRLGNLNTLPNSPLARRDLERIAAALIKIVIADRRGAAGAAITLGDGLGDGLIAG